MKLVKLCGYFAFLFISLTVTAQVPKESEPQKLLQVSVPNQPWEVEVNQPGFIIEIELPSADRNYLQAHNKDTGIKLSVSINRSEISGQSGMDSCRKWLSSERTRISSITLGKATNLSSREVKGAPVLEYSLHVMGLKSQVLLACMAKDEYAIQLNMDKDKFKPNDEQLFASILDATQVLPAEPHELPKSQDPSKPWVIPTAPAKAPESKHEPPAPAPASDLYRSSFPGDVYSNEFFGFHFNFPH